MKTKKLVIYGGLAALGYYLFKRSQTSPAAVKTIAPMPVQVLPNGANPVPTQTPPIAPDQTLTQAAATAAAPATAGVGPKTVLSGTVFSANRGLGTLG
jgi:hypothetical protein